MLLAIDVGNTQTVIGVCHEEELIYRWRVSTNKGYTSDELRVTLLPLLASEGIAQESLCGVVLASVVPHLTAAWCEVAYRLTGKSAVVCSVDTAAPLFVTDFANPYEIGSDRIANAVAAKTHYGYPVVVVDFGTATNIEVIDKEGCFVGGVIAPGMETSSFALFSKATKLGAIELIDPGAVIGRNTEQAVQAGIVYGEIDRVDGLVQRIFDELGYRTPVIATGGLAARVVALSQAITDVNVDLTLEGLRIVYKEYSA